MKKKKNKGEHSNIYLIGSVLFFLFFLLVLLISFIIIIIMYVSPAREYMKDSLVINTIIVFLILFLASSLVASIIFYFAFKKLLKPVVELSKQSMKVADGDFSIKINEKSLIRGALLHDYFLYDWHKSDQGHRLHAFFHAERNPPSGRRRS